MLSAALDSGVAISVLVIFFCLQFPNSGTVCVALWCMFFYGILTWLLVFFFLSDLVDWCYDH